MYKLRYYFPHLLLVFYLIECIILGINPYDRGIWFAENLPVWLVVLPLVFTFKSFRFTNLSYLLMAIFLCYHTLGGHYTFEKVPFETGNRILNYLNLDFLFPEGRNNFDRLGHFLVGVFAYPIAELSLRKKWVTTAGIATTLGILAIGFWAALYEVIEMIYAVLQGGEQGAAFLGSQGDIWDAQKDMMMDMLGALLFGGMFYFRWRKKK